MYIDMPQVLIECSLFIYLFIYLFIFCSSQQGKIINPFPEEQKSPVCIYMTQEVQIEGCVLFTLG